MSILNQKVVDFARSKVGQRIFAEAPNALGECWDLAFQALKESGAKTPHDFGNVYVWSSNKVSIGQVRAGDIIQYRMLKIEVVSVEAISDSEGTTTITKTQTFEIGLPNHTAVVKACNANGVIEVFEQNMNGKKETAINTYYLVPGEYTIGNSKVKVKKKSGTMTIYRPEPKN